MSTSITKTVPPQARSLVDAGLQSLLLFPEDAHYLAREESYWSNNAKLSPACIVQPTKTAEVAAIVKALVEADQQFAIRSGGHTNWAGANNIKHGVTIDLGKMDETTYDAASETVSIGPGARWRQVYAKLHEYGRVVAGGREGNVGVAGLLLGGGNTFFTARQGFACDNVVAYQVVLGSGEVVLADASNNADLFYALKGGSNNFGVVTNFRMKAIECDNVWAGMTFYPKTGIPEAIEALIAFTDNVASDIYSNLACLFTHMPDFKDIVIATMFAQVKGVANAPAYEKWLAIPEMMNTRKITTIKDMAFEYNIPANYHDMWFTATFKNDARIITQASDLHNKLVEELRVFIPNGDFVTQCMFQPLPAIFGQRTVEAGGNMLGLDRQKDNGILFLAVAMVRTPEQDAFVRPKVQAWIQGVKDFAATIKGGQHDLTFLCYSDGSQSPLASYGLENVKKMKEVAIKYDPAQVFQKLVPGGFKISKV